MSSSSVSPCTEQYRQRQWLSRCRDVIIISQFVYRAVSSMFMVVKRVRCHHPSVLKVCHTFILSQQSLSGSELPSPSWFKYSIRRQWGNTDAYCKEMGGLRLCCHDSGPGVFSWCVVNVVKHSRSVAERGGPLV